MLGWHISVYRQMDGGASPATADSPKGTRLAVWQADMWGRDWLDELVKAGKAINLGGDGYPSYFTATAEYLIPRFVDEPPRAHKTWMRDEYDFVSPKWEGKTVVDRAATSACCPEEWLLVVVWDES